MKRKKDPKVRKDGRCYVCLKDREVERSVSYGREQAQDDPFCSTECCREFHGTVLPPAVRQPPATYIIPGIR